MAFTKITQSELNSRGATTLDNTPQIGAQKLKEEFDAPAKQIVAPAVNRLVDELEADTGAMSLGANVPTGLPIGTQSNVQSILSALTIEVNKKEDTPENADVLNALSDVDGELFYGEQKMAKSSELPTKISDLTNDSDFVEDADYVHTDNNFTNEDKESIANKVDKVDGKGLSTNDYTNDDKETLYGVAAELAEKVDKEPGKGLSANNYTNEDKTKLDGIEDGANNYVLPVATDSTLGGVKADGTTTEIEADGTIKVIGGGSGGASIDDTTTSTDSVWSSEKTNTEITSVSDKVAQQYELGYLKKNYIDISYAEQGSIDGTTGKDVDFVQGGRGENYIKVNPNTFYILSCNKVVTNLRISEYKVDYTHVIRKVITNAKEFLVKTGETTEYVRWSINYDNSTSVTKAIMESLDLQFEEGKVATKFTPYSESNVALTDKVNSIYEGGFARVNLYPYGTLPPTWENPTYITLKKGTYTISTKTKSLFRFYAKLSKNGSVVTTNGHISGNGVNFSTSSYNYYVSANVTEFTFTLDDDYDVFLSTLDDYANKDMVMVESGSSATTYQPYTDSNVVLTDKVNAVYDGGFASRNLFDGKFEQGLTSGTSTTRLRSVSVIPIVKGKTYTFSASDYSYYYNVNILYGSNGTYPWNPTTGSSWIQNKYTFTATDNGFVSITVHNSGNTTILPSDIANIKIQFEESAEATPYTEYAKSNVELTEELSVEEVVASLSSGVTSQLNSVRKSGKVVVFTFQLTVDSITNEFRTVGAVPSAFVPPIMATGAALIRSNPDRNIIVLIDTYGVIKMMSVTELTNVGIYGQITWILD